MNFDFLDKIKILVVGDIMTDRYIIGTADRISGEAPVPIVKVERVEERPGGAANVHANLLALGVSTMLFDKIGGSPEIIKTRIIAHNHQICRFDNEQEPQAYSLDKHTDRLEEVACGFHAVIISDYAKGTITQPVIDCLREARVKHGTFLAMDPKPRNRIDVSGMDLLTPNESEIHQMIEQGRYPDAKYMLVTRGAKGMALHTPGGSFDVPAETNNLVDVTGAGDTVVAAMTAALVGGKTPHEAAYFASRCAAIVVSKFGTATCTREELANWRSPTEVER